MVRGRYAAYHLIPKTEYLVSVWINVKLVGH